DQALPSIVEEDADALQLGTDLAARRILVERAGERVERVGRVAQLGRVELADAHEQADAPVRARGVAELDLVDLDQIAPRLDLLVDRLQDSPPPPPLAPPPPPLLH